MDLKAGAVLQDRYVIQQTLGEVGPIDITYQALDRLENSVVIVREYFPVHLVSRSADSPECDPIDKDVFAFGLSQYELEGNALIKLSHSNVVPCRSQFNENGTIYRVSDRLLGISMLAYLRQRGGLIAEKESLELAIPFLQGLAAGHQVGLFHGAITPRGVFLDRGKTPMLLNFQAARVIASQAMDKVDEVKERGFSPPEIRMDQSAIGPWTDVFSSAALIYFMISGRQLPSVIYPSHQERIYQAIDKSNIISDSLKGVLRRALEYDFNKRPRTISALLELIQDRASEDTIPFEVQTSHADDFLASTGLLDLNSVRVSQESPKLEELEGILDRLETDVAKSQVGTPRRKAKIEKQKPVESAAPVTSIPMESHVPIRRTQNLKSRERVIPGRGSGKFNRRIVVGLLLVAAAALTFFFGDQLGDRLRAPSDAGSALAQTVTVSPAANQAVSGGMEETETIRDEEGENYTEANTHSQGMPAPEDDGSGDTMQEFREPQESSADRELASNANVSASTTTTDVDVDAIRAEALREAEVAAREAEQRFESERQYQYYRGQGDVLLAQKQWTEAVDAYGQALTYSPGDKYLEAQMEAARDSAEYEATVSAPEVELERQYQYLRGQGDAHFQGGDWEKALTAYNSASLLVPGDSQLTQLISIVRDSIETAERVADGKKRLEQRIESVTDDAGIFILPDTPPQLLEESTLRSRITYPARARDAGIEGRVVIRLVVDENGQVENPTVSQGIGFGCDKEVLRVISSAQFEPAAFDGNPVKAWYLFAVHFSLD